MSIRQMFGQISAASRSQSNSFCLFRSCQFQHRCNVVTSSRTVLASAFGSKVSEGSPIRLNLSKRRRIVNASIMSSSLNSTGCQLRVHGFHSSHGGVSVRQSLPKRERVWKISWNVRPAKWVLGGAMGVCLSFSSLKPAYAESPMSQNDKEAERDASYINTSHGKKVHTDYSITGIPGDGRCLFRSVAHGACLRSGKKLPNEIVQRELADELRARVADEFVKRRAETEWFVEGDFDSYVEQMRKPHVWGGEPELFMASHVLQMPITVYMRDEDSGGLIAIAEYGQEYGKEDPIRVLYHGFGHYDSLQFPGRKSAKSRL
ncbi:OTU domain-containing protein [Acorus calamus]|uniref:Ubiquitin thioesterase OTU n=1 Tax=Acorus calamus TaxID=4465 RepID=A0AAV9E1G6_ACOCL|nr:OTU domain-containing protein [Acorus calamus]